MQGLIQDRMQIALGQGLTVAVQLWGIAGD